MPYRGIPGALLSSSSLLYTKKTIGYYTVSIFSIRCDIIALSYLGIKIEKNALINSGLFSQIFAKLKVI